jgi:hypothetical protein
MKRLATFSGRTGDILWSLATVQEMWRRNNFERYDFAIMPQYANLLPLLNVQPYISNAFVLEDWILEGSPCGDQPWLPPRVPEGYDEVRHLTYRYHPNGECLSDFIARQQMIHLRDTCSPFIYVPEALQLTSDEPRIAFGFNWMAAEQKSNFVAELVKSLSILAEKGFSVVDVTPLGWLEAAAMIKACKFFLGCRSANYVLAHGLNKKVLVYEPAPERRPGTFGFRCGTEVMPEIGNIDEFVNVAKEWIQ